MSDEKKTVEFEKVPAWAVALKESVDEGFRELRGDISLVANDVTLVKERVAIVESRVGVVESRQDSNSMRAKEMSGVDMKHDAAIAQLVTDVAEVKATNEKQLAILTKLESVAANPMVRRIAYALGTLILTYLAAKGVVVK